ncbi:tyrosine-type recombinase/integrase [Dialister succinatiphilus]|uniref:tyrosine-type recombinase/integrase n=1 Tax=Dialister succinatiphilus TaxID=487173 RepID=UPI003AB8B5D4
MARKRAADVAPKKEPGKMPQGMYFDDERGYYVKRFNVEGKRYTVYGRTKRECADKETEKRQKIKEGGYIKNSAITLNDYFEEWKSRRERQVKGATLFSYSVNYEKHIRKEIGNRKVQKLERREILGLIGRVAKSSGVAAANHVKILLNQIFKSALYDEIISSNPVEHIPNMKMNRERPIRETTHRALTETEIETFLSACKNSWYYQFFRLMLATGMRCGECGALTWNDIDYVGGVIHVSHTITRDSKGTWTIGTTPKTEKSKRDIPMNAEIRDILQSQRANEEAIRGNVISLHSSIFTTEKGTFVTSNILTSIITSICNKVAKAGGDLKPFSSHALRDTFASMAYKKGVPMNVIKELMGHSSYAMTADLYGHIYDEQKKDAMEIMSV